MSAAAIAAVLADELENERLTVELMPAPRPMFPEHCIRVVTGMNPPWYRQLAKAIPPRGRPSRRSTGIRRDAVLRALRRIAAGRARGTAWERRLAPLVGA